MVWRRVLVTVFALLGSASACSSAAGPCSITPSPFWKNSIDFPSDPFRVDSGGFDEPGWVKFTILTCDPATVYFQDGNSYTFHYDFATTILDPFIGMTVAEFDDVTLYNDGRQALLGAVVLPPVGSGLPPPPPIPEYGIQLISQDPLDPQEVVDRFNTIQAAVNANPGVQAFYFPTFEQLASALENAAFFEANGIVLSSPARWADGNRCYSEGWALGRLKFFAADQIEAAFLAGDLAPDDILLTDGVPSDMPLVAGVVSLAPSTPNSHVVILANTFQIPFVFLALAEDASKASGLDGRRIVLRAFETDQDLDLGDACDVRLIDVEEELTQQQIDEILELKVPPPLAIQPIQSFGGYSSTTDVLVQEQIDHFGGKAVNFGFLRRSIPDASPKSVAISFDLWTQFLDQTMPGGMTLRQEIAATLAPFASFPPPDLQALADALAALRDRIEDDTEFTPFQKTAILTFLQDPQYGFDPFKKLRFRSSTNVEDGEQFTGAGLYDSKSGCLADDLDGDSAGPGQCDPTENNEKGVFRAIRKVFASFYYDNAFLERLKYGVDENDVGMALLVHHSFPDEIELANGVATYERTTGLADKILLVSQVGDESVTNPTPGTIPEEVEATVHNPVNIFVNLIAESNLLPLGSTVMEWTADYVELSGLLLDAADQFALETGKSEFVLDFEYKKMAPGGGALPAGGLVVKQIREIPQPDETPSITPFLVNDPTELVTSAGYLGRVKARWTVETRNLWLDPVGLAGGSLYTDVAMEFTDGCRLRNLSGTMAGLPGATHGYDSGTMASTDGWVLSNLPNPRSYSLVTGGLGDLVSPAESPILTLRDIAEGYPGLTVTVQHLFPLPAYPGAATTTTTDQVGMLVPADAGHQAGSWDFGGGVTVATELVLRPIVGFCGGCIPIGSRFVETTITGLTTWPIVLDGFYSQTYQATTHGFTEVFSFEPILEPGLPLQTLNELEAQDIRVIQVFVDNIFETISLNLFTDAEVGDPCFPAGVSGSMDAPSSLTVTKATADTILLFWGDSCVLSDDDYAVYEGTLGDFTSHVPVSCGTEGSQSASVTVGAGDSYYLVVPRNAHFEGSYGLDGGGLERDPSSSACYAQELGACP